MRLQPVTQRQQSPHRRLELGHLLLHPALLRRHADASGHLRLVHVERRTTLEDRLHDRPPLGLEPRQQSPAKPPEQTNLIGVLMATVRSTGGGSDAKLTTGSRAPGPKATSPGNATIIEHFIRPRVPDRGHSN